MTFEIIGYHLLRFKIYYSFSLLVQLSILLLDHSSDQLLTLQLRQGSLDIVVN